MIRSRRLPFSIALVAALPVGFASSAHAASVLYCVDGVNGTDQMATALAASEHTVTSTSSIPECEVLIAEGAWDLVILAIQSNYQATPTFLEYVEAGGSAILSDWSSDADALARQALFGVETVTYNESPLVVDSPLLSAGLEDSLAVYNPSWGVYAVTVRPIAGTSLATFASGSGITLDPTGRLLYNGFTTDSVDSTNGPILYANELALLLGERDVDGDGYDAGDDCDDSDPSVNPAAAELCNEIDDNCDSSVDEGVTSLFYADADADSYGSPDGVVEACELEPGFVADGTDCDDTNASVHPGADELCNGLDDDCEGTVDSGALDATTYFADADGDSHGDIGSSADFCAETAGYVASSDDCDDTSASVFPGAAETANSIDDDCNGKADDGIDTDGDGLEDYDEVETHDTDPTVADTDGDGHDDGDEVTAGTDPLDADDPADPDDTDDTDDTDDPDDTDDTDDTDEAPDANGDDPAACGCATTDAGAASWLGLVGLGFVLRTRRRRS